MHLLMLIVMMKTNTLNKEKSLGNTISQRLPYVTCYLSVLFLGLVLLSNCKKTQTYNDLSYMALFQQFPSDSFALVFLSSFEGQVEPCGCTADPLGGIAALLRCIITLKRQLIAKLHL